MKPTRNYEKCFITVGTTRFDLLCKTIMTVPVIKVLKDLGCKEITFQIGKSDTETGDYDIEGVKLHLYRYKDSIEEDIRNADLVISHAGAGSCLEVLDANKPLLVVVNEDLMDNHQLELAEQMQIDGHLYYCTCDTLKCTLEEVDFTRLVPLKKANPKPFFTALNKLLNIKESVD